MPRPFLVDYDDDSPVYAALAALLRSDHLGIEFACCAHPNVLEEAGRHPAGNTLCADQLILHNKSVTGLVVDDDFCLSSEDLAGARGDRYIASSQSSEFLLRAKKAYDHEGILGSDDKEISGSLRYMIIGAEVISSEGIEVHLASCVYGSLHQNKFAFLTRP